MASVFLGINDRTFTYESTAARAEHVGAGVRYPIDFAITQDDTAYIVNRGREDRPDGTRLTVFKLGEDGHLPELQLVEGETRKTVEASKKQSNPIIIYAVLAFSMCASLLMVVVDFEPPAATQEQRDKARQLIVRFYGINKGNLEPYQALLREARLARSRGDFATERRNFAQVLTKLNAEDTAQSFSGLTGDRGDPEKLPDDDDEFLREFDQKLLPSSDQVLRHLISILLRR